MKFESKGKAALVAGALAATLALPAPAAAQSEMSGAYQEQPAEVIELSQGKGTLLNLPRAIDDIFVVNDSVADVEVKSPREVYIYGTGGGETSIYATNPAGETVYSATIRVVRNIEQVREMLKIAMPQAQIDVQSIGGIAFLTGTVSSPEEVAEAETLVRTITGQKSIVNRIQAAVPPQVNLRVRFAEVSRDIVKSLGFSFSALGSGTDFVFGVANGRDGIVAPNGGFVATPGGGGQFVSTDQGVSSFLVGSLLGLDFEATIDALETDGLLTTLAEPNLTALSGETANFLAGGEFPVVTSSGLNGTNVQFKPYGVEVSFAPVVLDDNRIRMVVEPSVSELSEAGAVRVDGISIPALISRSASTTVELGSGQSFMIGGLTRNSFTTSTDKVPLLGDLPILGALFKSDSFRRSETELVIIITPYLVKPVSTRMALPTDVMRAPTDAERVALGRTYATAKDTTPTDVIAPALPASPGFDID